MVLMVHHNNFSYFLWLRHGHSFELSWNGVTVEQEKKTTQSHLAKCLDWWTRHTSRTGCIYIAGQVTLCIQCLNSQLIFQKLALLLTNVFKVLYRKWTKNPQRISCIYSNTAAISKWLLCYLCVTVTDLYISLWNVSNVFKQYICQRIIR